MKVIAQPQPRFFFTSRIGNPPKSKGFVGSLLISWGFISRPLPLAAGVPLFFDLGTEIVLLMTKIKGYKPGKQLLSMFSPHILRCLKLI